MSEEHIELRGSNAFELQRLERVLSGLARPALDEDSMAPSTRDALLQLGICVGGGASRRDVIERRWGRKRSLIRQMSARRPGPDPASSVIAKHLTSERFGLPRRTPEPGRVL